MTRKCHNHSSQAAVLQTDIWSCSGSTLRLLPLNPMCNIRASNTFSVVSSSYCGKDIWLKNNTQVSPVSDTITDHRQNNPK